MVWIIFILLLLILVDVVRLHRKVDRLTNFMHPKVPPTDAEIEHELVSESKSDER